MEPVARESTVKEGVQSAEQPPPGDDASPHSSDRRRTRGAIWRWLLLLGMAVGVFAVWQLQERRRTAAEAAAKSEIQSLGGLMMSGSAGEHVGSLNLSLLRDPENLERALNLTPDLHWLEVLDVSGKSISAQQLAGLATLRQLSSLQLGRTGIDDSIAACFVGFPALKALHLGGNNLTSDSLDSIASITTLEVLDVSDMEIKGDLSPLAALTKLEWLVLRNVPLNDAAIETLSNLPSLGRLTLQADQISQEQLKQLRLQRPGIRVDGMDAEEPEGR